VQRLMLGFLVLAVVLAVCVGCGGGGGSAIPVATISGKVTLGGYKGDAATVPVVLELRKHGLSTTTATVNLDSAGYYSLGGVQYGTYDLAFKASHWLRRVLKDVVINGNVSGQDASLINGDIDGDNVVGKADYDILQLDWNTSAPRSDVNGDGLVDLIDFGYLMANWGKAGDP